MPQIVLDGETFRRVAVIEPERAESGEVREFTPAAVRRYPDEILNPYGKGPFCRLRVAESIRSGGVYAITLDVRVVYVGRTRGLADRFGSSGFGSISKSSCLKTGQSTNCKVNSLIMRAASENSQIELWFHKDANPKILEERLIIRLDPEWNTNRPFVTGKYG